MTSKKNIVFTIACAAGMALGLIFSSCTKDVDVVVPDYQQRLVVEGAIEPGELSYVILTWTVPYFGNVSYTDVEQYMVNGALVTVSEGTTTDTLKQLIPNTPYYLGQQITGVTGNTYTLSITVNGKNYTSVTTIPQAIPLDSLYFKPEKGDSLGFVWAHFKEPEGTGHQYRWFAQRIGEDTRFLAPFSSVFDDKFIDGKEFDFAYDRGMEPNSTTEEDTGPERGYFKTGDTVVVKYCTIGEKEFRYFRSWYMNMMSNGNPFAAPSNLESTISGDAIGCWCGYGVFKKGVRLKLP